MHWSCGLGSLQEVLSTIPSFYEEQQNGGPQWSHPSYAKCHTFPNPEEVWLVILLLMFQEERFGAHNK